MLKITIYYQKIQCLVLFAFPHQSPFWKETLLFKQDPVQLFGQHYSLVNSFHASPEPGKHTVS